MCFCGNTFGLYGAVDTEVDSISCTVPCIGNRRQMCGGYVRNYIYDVDGTRNKSLLKRYNYYKNIGFINRCLIPNDHDQWSLWYLQGGPQKRGTFLLSISSPIIENFQNSVTGTLC